MENTSTQQTVRPLPVRIISVLLACALACSFVSTGALSVAWADGSAATIGAADATLIGLLDESVADDGKVYYAEAPEGTTSITFSDLTDNCAEYGMIAQIAGNGYVEGTDTVTVDPSWAVSRQTLEEEFSLDQAAIEGLDLDSNLYGFWLMDDDCSTYYYVVSIPSQGAAAADPEPLSFTAKVGDQQLTDDDISKAVGGYTYHNYLGVDSTVDLYTLTVPQGTTEVTLAFSRGVLVYNYKDNPAYDEGYLDGAVPNDQIGIGITEITVKVDSNNDGVLDFVQVQDPYDANWNSTLLMGLTFKIAGDPLTPSPIKNAVSLASPDSDLQATYETLFKAIEGGLDGVGTADGYDSDQHWMVIAAAATGNADKISQDKVVAEAVAKAAAPGYTDLQIAALQATAAGLDATALPTDDGSSLDLIKQMANAAVITDGSASSKAFALLAYAAGPYADYPDAPNSVRNLIDGIVEQQQENGSFGYTWGGTFFEDVDSTAMVIPGLAAYSEDQAAKDAMDAAVAYLLSQQNADGSFGSFDGVMGEGNVNSTATAIIALCSVGIDPNNLSVARSIDGAKNALRAMLAGANSELTGFTYGGQDNALATGQGFLAMAAYQGMSNTGKAYNVYLQASQGEAGLNVQSGDLDPEDPEGDSAATTTPVAGAASGGSSPSTGDYMLGGVAVLLIAGAAGLTVVVVARRKAKEQ